VIASWFRPSSPKIRTFERAPGGVVEIPFQSLEKRTPTALPSRGVSQEQLEAWKDQVYAQRQQQIQRPTPAHHGPAVAKDASLDPSAYYMAYDPWDAASLGYIKEMAAVGQVEDFHVIASCSGALSRWRLEQKVTENLTTLKNPGSLDVWTEDHAEYTEDGFLVMPAILPADYPIEDVIGADRLRRFRGDSEKVDFDAHGAVTERQTQMEALGAAMATGANGYKMAVSYVEGGNMMGGKRPDGTPYVLVGKDSLAVTRDLLAEQGRRHGAKEGLEQIARDYGYAADQVFAVEQPGEFHIDMAMALAGPGQVLLNDAKAVAELQKGWVSEHYSHQFFQWGKKRQLEAIEERAERLAAYEAMVEKDLKKAGLQVFRVAGNFPETKANSAMNFFNLRQGRNHQGETFAIALGGEEKAEEAFAHSLLSEIPSGHQRIHFLDRDLTARTLSLSGGLKCRTKPRQDLA
jgi:hypothetical protein